MIRILNLLLFCLLGLTTFAQNQPVPTTQAEPDTTKAKPVIIDYAELFERVIEDGVTIQRLKGEVELRQDSVFIYCDEAIITNDTFVIARGNVVVRQNDTISTFADSLEFFVERELAYLYGNVVLVNGKQQLFTQALRYDLANKRATYTTRAKLTDGEAQLSSIRGLYDVNAHYADFKDSVFVVRPDFNLIADSLGFETQQRIVYFEGPTVMATPDSRVYCEDGYYRLADTSGVFSNNAQVARQTQRAVADTIKYFGASDQFELSGNARFVDGDRRAKANSILYDERRNTTQLIGDAMFIEGQQKVEGERIVYDGETQFFNSIGRIRISEPPFLLNSDSLWFDQLSGIAHVKGNVVWRDTLENRRIEADFVEYKKEGDYVKAYGGRPVFSMEIESDTLFLRADTLLTFLEPVAASNELVSTDYMLSDTLSSAADTTQTAQNEVDNDDRPDVESRLIPMPVGDTMMQVASVADTLFNEAVPDSVRKLLAFRDVKIFKSNLQAVCDSMAFNELDSAFTLFSSPIVWSDTSQFLADTITMNLRNETIHKVLLRTKAMIINSPDEIFYNQVKGRQVTVDFDEGVVDQMAVRGNAESVYYIQDDNNAYIGVNHVKSARMRLVFADGQLNDIYFYDQPEGDLKPLKPIGEEPEMLEDFKWETEKRPLSRKLLE